MRVRSILVSLTLALLAIACSSQLDPAFDAEPTPTPQQFDDGDARHGSLVFSDTRSINDCRILVDGTGSTLTLSSSLGLIEGDRVLLWQVQDVFAALSTATSIAIPERAGRWEIVTVAAENGLTVALETSALNHYKTGANARAQACHVPQYGTVHVQGGGILRANEWSEAAGVGGVVALFATGTVTIDGSIIADGAGFEGGPGGMGSTSAEDALDLEYFDRDGGASKGAGLDGTARSRFGRGALANGCGGGNAHNAGGGGGGNAGAGGCGGRQSINSDETLYETKGAGGAAIVVSPLDRLLFGGGGGAADQDSCNGACVDGADGGGVILVFSGAFAGTGEIRANGNKADTLSATSGDGGPGGGAGGTILIRTRASGFTGIVRANGGTGGDAGPLGPGNYRGPGGGGGGGSILTMGLVGATLEADPGTAGTNPGGGPTPDPAWWAQPGGQGAAVPLPAP